MIQLASVVYLSPLQEYVGDSFQTDIRIRLLIPFYCCPSIDHKFDSITGFYMAYLKIFFYQIKTPNSMPFHIVLTYLIKFSDNHYTVSRHKAPIVLSLRYKSWQPSVLLVESKALLEVILLNFS